MSTPNVSPNAESEVLAISNRWVQAELSGNVAAVDELLADSYTSITSLGTVMTKAQWLEMLPKYQFETLSYSDVSVQLYGSIGILRGVFTIQANTGEKELAGKYQSTDIFLSEAGAWKAIASQLTKIVS